MKPLDDPEGLRALVPDAIKQVEFFGEAGKKDREKWVLDRWLAHLGIPEAVVTAGEGPDFRVDDRPIEIVEVLTPDRRRHAEYKADLAALSQGREVEWRNFEPLERVKSEGRTWIVDAVRDKRDHYRQSAKDWVLLVYVDFGWSSHVDWDGVREDIAKDVPVFREIWAVLTDNQVMRLKP